MAIVTLELLKKHVRADDFEEDDVLLQQYLTSAEEYVIKETHRTAEELTALGGGVFPPMLVQAILMTAAHWYNQRESVSPTQMSEVPYTLQALVKPFRKLV